MHTPSAAEGLSYASLARDPWHVRLDQALWPRRTRRHRYRICVADCVFVALAIAVGAQILGSNINTLFSNIGNYISNIKMPPLP